jgi:hypothetical protein
MSNFFGLDDQITGDIRLNGIGWIGAMLVVGLSILAARGKNAVAAEEGKGPGGQRKSEDG